jgi:1-aminocyclopropane-1-carboxylate deaminase/D-cysteine desulfhydrase-like pyridoxal-dependent ACC family enzyme
MTSMTEEARNIVDGKRQEDYGSINDSFCRIAGLWSAYTGITLDKYDVAKMMILLKVSRAKLGNHRDSYVDVVGYVECVDKLLALDEGCHDFFNKIATATPEVSVAGA